MKANSVGASQAATQEVQPGIFKVAKGASQKFDQHGSGLTSNGPAA